MKSLFDLDFVDSSMRVGIIKLSPGQRCSVVLSSERVPCYEVHFIGRAFICPGAGCPACGQVAKRLHGLAVSGTNRNVQFVELGAPTIVRMDAIRREDNIRTLIGTRWSFGRAAHKRPIIAEYIGQEEPDSYEKISDTTLMRAITRLYCLPSPGRDWTWEQFEDRVRETLHRQLRRALLTE